MPRVAADVDVPRSPFVEAAPASRMFEVVSVDPDGELEVELIAAHSHSVNNPGGHLIFVDCDEDGIFFHRRTIHSAVWRSVREVAVAVVAKARMN